MIAVPPAPASPIIRPLSGPPEDAPGAPVGALVAGISVAGTSVAGICVGAFVGASVGGTAVAFGSSVGKGFPALTASFNNDYFIKYVHNSLSYSVIIIARL